MKVTIGIPTYNRAELWRKGKLWDSLMDQSILPDEVVIVDDNSSDETVEVLSQFEKPFPVRVFKTNLPKTGKHNDSAFADNVIFKESTGDWLLHVDDDGWIDYRAVETIHKLSALGETAWYGNIYYVDAETMEVLDKDIRLSMGKITEDYAWGALWAAPLPLLRRIGGHEERWIGKLGCDARLGTRIARMGVRQAFYTGPEFRFYHFGLTTWQWYNKTNRKGEVYKHWVVPQHGQIESRPIVNGGEKYWARLTEYVEA
jgi:glycosyltransferase involved in cell wall biosynthesis